ncbi:uncharacterized protein KY384_006826 [Bacidia gigantensis]|uniref:uncharacterized protein n=1 Tax=Bacidia gigantensis TaxID=2732470 RepID=UPI001D05A261|nr:uncharacterized protein KY384_006826 [Bacidia gigantensis]KAG8527910.1 hypothetical protein KY384_006826 [Bacidia gigantensis]
MGSPLINQAFASRKDLRQQIYKATSQNHNLTPLFESIAQYINSLTSTQPSSIIAEHPLKKRKIENDTAAEWTGSDLITFDDLSFTLPQRKKLKLSLNLALNGGIRVLNPTGDIETQTPWSSILEIACLPVPEKTQAQFNFCIFTNPLPNTSSEQILFTVPATPPKPGTVHGLTDSDPKDATYNSILTMHLNAALKRRNLIVTLPSEAVFTSHLPQATRKGEKAYHVKAFRGAKEGFLFFLRTGIIWGFKKPLEFFPFHVIESVSYTSVLQRTFNLVIVVRRDVGDGEEQEFEFSMVDQADFAGIDEYVKRRGLQDKSLADERRARKFNVNGVKGENGAGEDGEGDGEGELEKAAKDVEAQDGEEDEEDDENFDPGSEGESEGEGDTSEDDGEGGGGE